MDRRINRIFSRFVMPVLETILYGMFSQNVFYILVTFVLYAFVVIIIRFKKNEVYIKLSLFKNKCYE